MTFDLDDNSINDLQRESIAKLLERLKWSRSADILVRKDGQDYRYQADWLKHLKPRAH